MKVKCDHDHISLSSTTLLLTENYLLFSLTPARGLNIVDVSLLISIQTSFLFYSWIEKSIESSKPHTAGKSPMFPINSISGFPIIAER